MRLSAFASGASSGIAWADSVTDTTPPGVGNGILDAEVAYVERMEDAWVAPAGSLFGLRWTVSAESRRTGTSIAGTMAADFGDTSCIGFEIAADAPPGAVLSGVLVAAPAPEPGIAWLLGAGLAGLRLRTRTKRRRDAR